MDNQILESHEHYCFHSAVLKCHTHPELHCCDEERCPTAVRPEVAQRAGMVDEDGKVRCPSCGCSTTLKREERLAEVHAKLCTDPTIHYPDLYRAGKIDRKTFEDWKSTLSPKELMGHYKRVPDVHVVANFTHEETSLIDTDPEAFNELLNDRIRARAEAVLLHQVQYRHSTETTHIKL
jgi:hypothetical protein